MKKIIQVLVFIISFLPVQAQVDGTIDGSFLGNNKGQQGASSVVYVMALQSDAKIILGGAFETYNQIEKNRLVRINPDGSMDTTFNQTFLRSTGNAAIGAIALQPDGKILVGGNFEVRTPFPDDYLLAQDIMRLNADGTRDVSFLNSITPGGCGNIKSIALQSDGKIILAGDITSCLGSTLDNNENIIRLNADGTLDDTFNAIVNDTTFNFSEEPIYSVIVLPDGKILIAGNFNEVNGTLQSRLARLNADGTLDTSFDIGSGFDEVVNEIKLQPDGKIIAVGDFTEFNGSVKNKILRLNSDGFLDPSFDSGESVGRFQPLNSFTSLRNIETVSVQLDGKIIIGGDYNRYDGSPVSRLTRLNSDGSLDSAFSNIDDLGVISTVSTSLILPDGSIIAGGNFNLHNEQRKNRIIKLTSSGSVDLDFNKTSGPSYQYFNTEVLSVQKAANNKLYIGGQFREYDDVTSNNIARINADGSIDTSFNTGIGLSSGFDNKVRSFKELGDGKIIVVGDFENYNQSPAPGIVRLNSDGSIDITFNVGNGVDTANARAINTIALQQDGKFLIGGFFTQFDGFTTRNLARLNADGSVDTTFFVSNTSQVNNIHLMDNGQFFISVFSYNGDTIPGYLAKINSDGTRDTSFEASGIATGTTEIVKVLDNGQLLVGGFYSSQGSLFKLNADGSIDNTFTPPVILDSDSSNSSRGSIYDLELQEDGKIIIGGKFQVIDERTIRGVARLNSDGTFDDTFNPEDLSADLETYAGTDDNINRIFDLELLDSGQLIVGGDFRGYNNEPKAPLIGLYAGLPATLGFQNYESDSLYQLYPNPAKNKVTLSSKTKINALEVFDSTGKKVMEIKTTGRKDQTLNISELSQGMYLLMVKTRNTVITKKLIIK